MTMKYVPPAMPERERTGPIDYRRAQPAPQADQASRRQGAEMSRHRASISRFKIEALLNALHEIVEPVKAMEARAKEMGHVLDGPMAVRLADDPEFLRGVARHALERWSLP
jgi:hypothetical protein